MKVTAPGKVLLLGGYAVLEYFPALSIALCDRKGGGSDADASPAGKHQLVSKEFGIECAIEENSLFSAIGLAPRLHRTSLAACSAAIAYLKGSGRKPSPLRIELGNSPIFGSPEEKSGLGSSAASTVAAVGAIFEGNGLDIGSHREEIHKVSQAAHAIATEKVGSGFDIATSAFGSIEYVRYERDFLEKELGGINDSNFPERLSDAVRKRWPLMDIKPFSMKGFGLLVFNIKGARTSTVSSVKAIRRLAEFVPELYRDRIRDQADAEAVALEGLRKNDPARIREGFHGARLAQRRMSEWVVRVGMMDFDPIEPPAITGLIDEAEKAGVVVAGRCPGSGGYDSVAFIVAEGKEKEASAVIESAAEKAGIALARIDAAVSDGGLKRAG